MAKGKKRLSVVCFHGVAVMFFGANLLMLTVFRADIISPVNVCDQEPDGSDITESAIQR